MTRRFLLAAAGAVLLTLPAPVPALAHPGHDHKLMGTIAAVDKGRVTLKTNDGKERTFKINEKTKLLQGKKKGLANDLKVGMRLVVNVGNGEDPLVAKEVTYGQVAASTEK